MNSKNDENTKEETRWMEEMDKRERIGIEDIERNKISKQRD